MADLTEKQWRAAAAGRPGYATYPQYRPSSQERLAPLRIRPTDGSGHPVVVGRPLAPPVSAEPIAARVPVPLAELPPTRIYEFPLEYAKHRPRWRRRWMWAVMPATGHTAWGYCWTESGARRRTARAARKAGSL
ncbi:hypothetical protein [Micromonospora chokoriensis]|uniref:hypothetical protein n=1 Tax=Micromonospora chokoriensis TaxID=356851 RepID=UPI0004C345F2|nr:hypothetical protein [Micromonospora chokoriensis]